jgi:hypothetical protein
MIAYVLNGVINKPARDALLIDHALREFSSKETAISSSDEVNEPCYELLISRLVRLHWDWAYMLRVKESYYARYQRSMEEDIKNATEGDFSAFCLSLVGSRSKENPVNDNATESIQEPCQLAQGPPLDPVMTAGPGESFYPDPEGILTSLCDICGISSNYCLHKISQESVPYICYFDAALAYQNS